MRVVFAGTPPFAVRALEALRAANHDVVLVLSQPDRPAGRGLKPQASAIAALARSLGLPVHQPPFLVSEAAQRPIREAKPDVLVVAAYGLILPQAVLESAPAGAINIHASLLPRWRGAAPIPRAILAGDVETGVAIMRMEAGLDVGPVLLEKRTPIGPRETSATLTERLSILGAEAVVEALAHWERLAPRPQDGAKATYAAKITRSEARIDWGAPSASIDRQIRAFDPFPGAESLLEGQILKIWEGDPCQGSGVPGTILEVDRSGLRVACGEGAITIKSMQKTGGNRLPVGDFLHGRPVSKGIRFQFGP